MRGSMLDRTLKHPSHWQTPEGTETDLEDEEEEEEESTLSEKIDASQFNNFKLVLVVRTDLGMTKGKVAAQCGHATLACYKSTMRTNAALIRQWEHTGQAKVALRCDSEEQM